MQKDFKVWRMKQEQVGAVRYEIIEPSFSTSSVLGVRMGTTEKTKLIEGTEFPSKEMLGRLTC